MSGYVGIPTSYTPVEYIESNGTQYIDTNISTNSNTKIEMEVQFNNANLQECIWCGRDFNSGGTGINSDTLFKFTNGIFRVDYNDIGTNFSHTVNTTTKYKYVHNKNLLYENNTLIYTSSSATFTTTNKLRLFAARNMDGSINNFFNGKVYSFKVYDNDTLVGDFIPVVDQDNVACLYEQVEGKFYYNQGTGSFTVGSATGQSVSIGGRARKIIKGYVGVRQSYTPVEYIESSGTQYIDTGFIPTANTKVDFDANIISGNSNAWLPVYGARSYTTSNYVVATYLCLYVHSDTHYLSPNYAGFDPGTSGNTTINFNQRYLLTQDRGQFYIDGVLKPGISTTNTITTGDKTMYLFTNNSAGETQLRGQDVKLYGCKIYENDVLVRDFIPVLDQDNVTCLYEQVEGKFYYNKGTGVFTAGNATGQPVMLGSVAKKIRKGYVGVNGVARQIFGASIPTYQRSISLSRNMINGTVINTENYILLAGGQTANGGIPVSTVTAYSSDLIAHSASNLPTAERSSAATYFNGKAIIAGGSSGSTGSNRNSQCVAYSDNLTVATLTALTTITYETSAAATNAHFMVLGGNDYNTAMSVTNAYDTSFVKTSPTNLSAGRRSKSAASVGEYIVSPGGMTSSSASTDFYDNNNVKTTGTNPYNKVTIWISGISTNSYAIFFGGGTADNTSYMYADCKAYDKNKVVQSFSLPTAMFKASGFSNGDYVFIAYSSHSYVYDDNLVLQASYTNVSYGDSNCCQQAAATSDFALHHVNWSTNIRVLSV